MVIRCDSAALIHRKGKSTHETLPLVCLGERERARQTLITTRIELDRYRNSADRYANHDLVNRFRP